MTFFRPRRFLQWIPGLPSPRGSRPENKELHEIRKTNAEGFDISEQLSLTKFLRAKGRKLPFPIALKGGTHRD